MVLLQKSFPIKIDAKSNFISILIEQNVFDLVKTKPQRGFHIAISITLSSLLVSISSTSILKHPSTAS